MTKFYGFANEQTNRLVANLMKDNKYEKILACSTRMISRDGFNSVSLQQIADRVGLHKSTLFHYFKNKKELLLRILEKSVGEVNKDLENIIETTGLEPEEKLRRAIDNHLVSLSEHIDNVNIYLNELRRLPKKDRKVYLRKRKKYEENFAKIVVAMKTKGYFTKLDTKITTFGILGMLNWVAKWYKRDGRLDIRDVSIIFYRMLTEK